ncbi:hypothetical protein BDP27DRAFT_1418535 [Rhodocollybia butyracea]|uniref:Uncharacterized protein n=1 Tax=Rhodocollybia butyracea TaxID=206335 RepID=A0A9P5UBC1_9AGAR|nr:hypothetical protein BDP27DRAFT_1418535 [Rhodocollybia butyracea]
MRFRISVILAIGLLATCGSQALNINRATGALPAIINRAPDPAPLADRSLIVEDPTFGRRELSARGGLGGLMKMGEKSGEKSSGNSERKAQRKLGVTY